jgi:hypothetical protein
MDVWWWYTLVVFILDANWDFGRIDACLTCLSWCWFLFMVFNFQFVDVLGGCRFQCGVVVMFFKLTIVDELWLEVLVILLWRHRWFKASLCSNIGPIIWSHRLLVGFILDLLWLFWEMLVIVVRYLKLPIIGGFFFWLMNYFF